MAFVAELTFLEELWKEVVGAVSTAALVGVAAAVIVRRYSDRRERSQERTQARRSLLERSSESAATFWIACQHSARSLSATEADAHAKIIEDLDRTYQAFIVQAVRIENEIWAWFGRTTPLGDYAANKLHTREDGAVASSRHVSKKVMEDTVSTQAWERWHQIRDLLTIYYFNLKADYTNDDVLFSIVHRNSIGHGDEFHSGIDLTATARPQNDSSTVRKEQLAKMRKEIRKEYESALGYLVRAILEGRMPTSDVARWRRIVGVRATRT